MASTRALALAVICAATLLALAGGAAGGRVDVGDLLMADRFRAWQAAHNRTYATDEERLRRFEVYRRNVEYIEATNRRGELSYELGENQFADLTGPEFLAMYTLNPAQAASSSARLRQLITTRAGPVSGDSNGNHGEKDGDDGEVPNSVDWRTKGAVTPIKDQKTCGSCWAFATVATIEGLHKLKKGHLVSLSEQELVDCDDGNNGCDGGSAGEAMEWVAGNGGITTESNYPYVATKGKCRRDRARNHTATVAGAEMVDTNSEAALERAVARQPVAVLIMVDASLQLYKGGVYSGPCSAVYDAAHAHVVAVVGYGADAGGRKYWIVKNSWAETWGEKGYVRMARRVSAKEGLCGIAKVAFYPVM